MVSTSVLHKHDLKSNHKILLATYKNTLSQQALSHMSPMAFKILSNAGIKSWVHLDLWPENLLIGEL